MFVDEKCLKNILWKTTKRDRKKCARSTGSKRCSQFIHHNTAWWLHTIQRVEIYSFSHQPDKMSSLSMMLLRPFSLRRFLIFVKLMIHYHQSKQMDGSLLCTLLLFSVKFSHETSKQLLSFVEVLFFPLSSYFVCECVCIFLSLRQIVTCCDLV